jgi:hypothetical protein
MADTTTQLAQTFNNSAPSAAASPCCKNVKGEWAEIPHPTVPDPRKDIDFLGIGQPKLTYYLGSSIPKGVSVPARIRARTRIKGTLICKCMDDGRQLSKTSIDKGVTVEGNVPIYSTTFLNKAVSGPLGWAILAYEIGKAGKQAYDIYSGNQEAIDAALKQMGPAAEKAVKEIINSADELCKNKHKCVDPPPPAPPTPPAPPGPPGQGDGDLIS